MLNYNFFHILMMVLVIKISTLILRSLSRIQETKIMRIHADADLQHWM
jgi:hypothetical protein